MIESIVRVARLRRPPPWVRAQTEQRKGFRVLDRRSVRSISAQLRPGLRKGLMSGPESDADFQNTLSGPVVNRANRG